MELRETRDGSKVVLEIVFSKEEYDSFEAVARAQVRCCKCENGKRHQFNESNDLKAFFRCVEKCGVKFQMSNDECYDDDEE